MRVVVEAGEGEGAGGGVAVGAAVGVGEGEDCVPDPVPEPVPEVVPVPVLLVLALVLLLEVVPEPVPPFVTRLKAPSFPEGAQFSKVPKLNPNSAKTKKTLPFFIDYRLPLPSKKQK